MSSSIVTAVVARGIPVRGNDIDTDRIIPARYLRCVTFDGLGDHPFEDDRKSDPRHPFDNDAYAGAGILIANRNFGCGSSREHAPQALMRWGIHALLGESFAEIFFGNCLALGIPCATLSHAAIKALMAAVEANPMTTLTLDLERQQVTAGGATYAAAIPDGARSQLIAGTWDTLAQLLDAKDAVAATAGRIPYLQTA